MNSSREPVRARALLRAPIPCRPPPRSLTCPDLSPSLSRTARRTPYGSASLRMRSVGGLGGNTPREFARAYPERSIPKCRIIFATCTRGSQRGVSAVRPRGVSEWYSPLRNSGWIFYVPFFFSSQLIFFVFVILGFLVFGFWVFVFLDFRCWVFGFWVFGFFIL